MTHTSITSGHGPELPVRRRKRPFGGRLPTGWRFPAIWRLRPIARHPEHNASWPRRDSYSQSITFIGDHRGLAGAAGCGCTRGCLSEVCDGQRSVLEVCCQPILIKCHRLRGVQDNVSLDLVPLDDHSRNAEPANVAKSFNHRQELSAHCGRQLANDIAVK